MCRAGRSCLPRPGSFQRVKADCVSPCVHIEARSLAKCHPISCHPAAAQRFGGFALRFEAAARALLLERGAFRTALHPPVPQVSDGGKTRSAQACAIRCRSRRAFRGVLFIAARTYKGVQSSNARAAAQTARVLGRRGLSGALRCDAVQRPDAVLKIYMPLRESRCGDAAGRSRQWECAPCRGRP